MSRIGKKPIAIPKGVTVKVASDAVEVQGPKGKLRQAIPPGIVFGAGVLVGGATVALARMRRLSENSLVEQDQHVTSGSQPGAKDRRASDRRFLRGFSRRSGAAPEAAASLTPGLTPRAPDR